MTVIATLELVHWTSASDLSGKMTWFF